MTDANGGGYVVHEPGRKGVNESSVCRDEASDLASEADEHRGCRSEFIGLQPTHKRSSNVNHRLPNRLAKWRRDMSDPPNASVMRDEEPETLSKANRRLSWRHANTCTSTESASSARRCACQSLRWDSSG